jgi:hypothetical protein
MAREYNALMPGNTLVTTAFPFFQLAAPSTRELKMLGFELGCSGAGGIVSQALDVVLSHGSGDARGEHAPLVVQHALRVAVDADTSVGRHVGRVHILDDEPRGGSRHGDHLQPELLLLRRVRVG